ncbi:hypothetical protein GCM10010406_23130 [Streptomyces thermolineatus]|uniref:Uncharacterized protein n=1 Tax=Streptomyces thermolineatus TaxID=44033 RepID=A0ABP5YV72_9ACTN
MSAALLAVLAVLSVLWAPTAGTAALRPAPAGTGAAVQALHAVQAPGPSRPGADSVPKPAPAPVFDPDPDPAQAPARADGPWRVPPGHAAVLQQAGEQHAPAGPGHAASAQAARQPLPGVGPPVPPAPDGARASAPPGTLPGVRGPPATTG